VTADASSVEDVNTLLEPTIIAAVGQHGTLARTIDTVVQEAADVVRRLNAAGIDMDDVGLALDDKGVAGFHAFLDMLAGLAARGHQSSGP
jgi:transaldolase